MNEKTLTPRCALYIRVSTEEQTKTSPENQIGTLKQLVEQRNLGKVHNDLIYRDDAISASKYSVYQRPGMSRLIEDAQKGMFDVLLFKSISRFARSASEALDLLEFFKELGIRVVSQEEGLDNRTRDGNLAWGLFALLAEQEAKTTGERVRLANIQKASRGEWVGHPPFGFTKEKKGKKLVPDKDTKHIVESIFEWYLNGMGTVMIARELNRRGWQKAPMKKGEPKRDWSRKTVIDLLKNPVYAGDTVFNRTKQERVRDRENRGAKKWKVTNNPRESWVIKQNTHTPIVSHEVFNKVQNLLEMKSQDQEPRTVKWPLTGITVCGKCGGRMITQRRTNSYGTYRYTSCVTYHRWGREKCDNGNIPTDGLEDFVLHSAQMRLRKSLDEIEQMKTYQEKQSNEVLLYQKQLKEYENELARIDEELLQLIMDKPHYSERQFNILREKLTRRNKQLEGLTQELRDKIRNIESKVINLDDIKKEIEDFLKLDKVKDPVFLRKILHSWVQKVVYNDKEDIKVITHF